MRVVLDCNVVIAAARTEGVCRAVLLSVVRHHDLVLIGADHQRVSNGRCPAQAQPLSSNDARRHRSARADSLDRRAAKLSFGLNDPDDQIYLATAIAGRAEALITGNVRHFPKLRYGPVTILRPAAFLFERQ